MTNEQLQQLRAMVDQIVADKGTADTATAASNQADTELAAATAVANQAKLDEGAADAKLSADVANLSAFISGLVPHTEPSNP
jgi:ethanolamine ammonia-lyase small subunit